MPIRFFSEHINFELEKPLTYKEWLTLVITKNEKLVGELNYIFCSDNHLLKINQDHLNHDYYTDIITFDNSEDPELIEADIYISIDRVTDNSQTLGVSFENELSRVMIHGLLHLFGYGDATEVQKNEMREKENAYISLQKK
jgi:rRNA maturation RNase YbeY